MATNPLLLRKNIDKLFLLKENSKEYFIKCLVNLFFTNQILINHKIVKFNSVSYLISRILNTPKDLLQETYYSLINQEYAFLKSQTDDLLVSERKRKIDNFFKNKQNDNKASKSNNDRLPTM